jgi:biopolymer transport protein ExbD
MSGRRGSRQDVDLNVASMLDMAFQLLAFFILTFRPPMSEGQIGLRLPPAQPTRSATNPKLVICGGHGPIISPAVTTLVVTVISQDGRIDGLGVGQDEAKDVRDLDGKLAAAFKDPNSPFEQVIVQASPRLNYGELMRVMDVCSRQTLSDGKKLDRLSLLELPEGNVR